MHKLKKLLLNEQKELKLNWISLSMQSICKLVWITFDKMHHTERYSDTVLDKDYDKIKNIDFKKLYTLK